MFEPNRLSAECMAQAYERIVPVLRRSLPSQSHERQINHQEVKPRKIGGTA